MEQLSMFSQLWQDYKIKKKVRLIEMFAGYGSQFLSLKRLGVDVESWKIAEWTIQSTQAYKDLHHYEDNTDYSKNLTREQIIDFLFERGISKDYKTPMTREQIVRLGEQRERESYNNIIATHNLVSVCNIKGSDLQIENKDKYEYILTYSFPCQDISGAGLGKGFSKGSGTRSGLLWEIERILNELQVENALPQILLMENVPLIHSIENWSDFEAWKQTLKDLGYCNFWKDLTATDYGIPQTRTRTFMISILGDYNYEFPKPIPLEKNLKDLCDDEVDEKYYVTRKFYEYATTQTGGAYNRGKNFYQSLKQTNEKGIAVTLTTNNNNVVNNFIADKPSFEEVYRKIKNSNFSQTRAKLQEGEVCDTLLARDYKDPKCIIENKALKETLEQNDLSAIKEIGFVDSYNRDIKTDGTVGTITTRVNASNNAFLIERRNTNEEK